MANNKDNIKVRRLEEFDDRELEEMANELPDSMKKKFIEHFRKKLGKTK